MEKQFEWRNSVINYTEYGAGNETLICFHGYGQNCSVFNVFEESLGRQYHIVSIDLPYQGKTIWRERKKLDNTLLLDLMLSFLNHIDASEKVSLLGYSIGGNYVLGLAQALPNKINRLWLIAADGLKPKPAFAFVTKTAIGRFLFKLFILYPGWVFLTAKLLKKSGVMSGKVLKFYKSTIDTKLKRQELFLRWNSTARITPGAKNAIRFLQSSNIGLTLIYGKRDSVISISTAEKVKKLIPRTQLFVIDKGHKLLVEETNSILNEALAKQNNNQL